MKLMCTVVVVLVLAAVSVYAGGDKVHGEKGKGNVHQVVGP